MTLQIPRAGAVLVVLASASVCLFGTQAASAAIIATTGSAQEREAPDSVRLGRWEANLRTRIFQEREAFQLDEDLFVDVSGGGNSAGGDDGGFAGEVDPNLITAGTLIDSYLIHQDSRGRSVRTLSGSVTFDQDILGIIVNNETLMATDAVVGSPDVLYPGLGLGLRQIEFANLVDLITISEDLRTITFTLQTNVVLDHIRVITAGAVIPTPGSLALLGLAGLVGARRRRRG